MTEHKMLVPGVLIGELLDQWDLLPNDIKSDLEEQAPRFHTALLELYDFVESD